MSRKLHARAACPPCNPGMTRLEPQTLSEPDANVGPDDHGHLMTLVQIPLKITTMLDPVHFGIIKLSKPKPHDAHDLHDPLPILSQQLQAPPACG
jgi:hypothetical protein